MITPKWMMVCALTGPYLVSEAGLPSYLDGLAFSGLVSLQKVEKKWPRTADDEEERVGILDAFEKSTQPMAASRAK